MDAYSGSYVFELVDAEQLHAVAAYGGFPTRYPHWRFGMDYEQLSKGYEFGLQKIYEMVINTNPSYAYLLEGNSTVDQKTVMAHVSGHVDFFKNNYFFSKTNRRMIDEMANHGARIRRYVDRRGIEIVEDFVDTCLSLDNLIDYMILHLYAGAEDWPHHNWFAARNRGHDVGDGRAGKWGRAGGHLVVGANYCRERKTGAEERVVGRHALHARHHLGAVVGLRVLLDVALFVVDDGERSLDSGTEGIAGDHLVGERGHAAAGEAHAPGLAGVLVLDPLGGRDWKRGLSLLLVSGDPGLAAGSSALRAPNPPVGTKHR